MSPPRILVVVQDHPWPATSGTRQRLTTMCRALATVGTIDLFSFAWDNRIEEFDVPAGAVARSAVQFYPGAYPNADISLAGRWRWWRSGLTSELAGSDFTGSREAFRAFLQPPYDVVWFSRAETYELLGDLVDAPVVVDLDDLEDRKILARIAATDYPRSLRGQLHRLTAAGQARLNVRRWRRLQQQAAAGSVAVLVCSDLDAKRLDVPNTVVMTNGYDRPDEPAGRASVGDPPTIMMAGVLFYPPNTDGARWLATEILPLLRATVPAAQVRFVGTPGPIAELEGQDGVQIAGRVPEMLPELQRCDLIAVPIRFGSGTRIKILEAFAHRIPVVSTTLGAEGLDVSDGVHLLLADTAADFAAACERLLADETLRVRLVDAAEAHYLEHFQWSKVERAAIELVQGAMAQGAVTAR